MLQPCSTNTKCENMAEMSIKTLYLETHKNMNVILGKRERVHLILNTVCESVACIVLEFELRNVRKDT
jgi:hypothetical protein